MKRKYKTFRKLGEYGISKELKGKTLRYKTKLYTAPSEEELFDYLKEKGIL